MISTEGNSPGKCKHTLVDGLEAGLLAVVESSRELDLRDRAASEVANGSARAGRCRSGSAGGRGGCSGAGSGSGRRVGSNSGGGSDSSSASGACDDVALVVYSGDSGERGLNAEGRVEGVSLSTRLGGLRIGSGRRGRARSLGCRVGATAVGQGITDELGDDINALGGTVVVRS